MFGRGDAGLSWPPAARPVLPSMPPRRTAVNAAREALAWFPTPVGSCKPDVQGLWRGDEPLATLRSALQFLLDY